MRGNVLFFCEPDNLDNVVLQKLIGIRDFAATAGWNVILCHAVTGPDVLKRYINLYRPLGCLVGTVVGFDKPSFAAIARKIPMVFIDQPPQFGHLKVNTSPIALAEAAVSHFRRLGYDSFAYVGAQGHRHWSLARYKAFNAQIRRGGGKSVPFVELLDNDRGPIVVLDALTDFLRRLPRQTAILCANDNTAILAMEAAKLANINIPRDLAFMGIDDAGTLCETSYPPLTSIRIDFRESGYVAASLLDKAIQTRPRRLRESVLITSVATINRESTAPQRAPTSTIARKAFNYIHSANLTTLSVKDTILMTGGSRRNVEKLFRATYGRSLLEEIKTLRIDRAILLLSQTNMKVSSVAAECGYKTPAQLQRMFRKATGFALDAYRRRSRTNS